MGCRSCTATFSHILTPALPPSLIIVHDRMFRSGASYKVIPKFVAAPFSTSALLSRLCPRKKQSPALVNIERPPDLGMEQGTTEGDNWSTVAENGSGYGETQGDANSNLRASWRPYRGRWNAKTVTRNDPGRAASQAPEKATPSNPRRSHRLRNQVSADRSMSSDKRAHQYRQEGPFPVRPAPSPSQSYSSQSNTHMGASHDGVSSHPNFNMPIFPGGPSGMAAFNEQALQFPFFSPNTANQQSQSQPSDQPAFGSFNTALPNDMSNPLNFFSLMPPPPFMMNFGIQNPAMAGPLLSGFPPLPFDPMAFAAAGSAGGNISDVLGQPPVGASATKDVASPPPKPPSPVKLYIEQSSLPPKLVTSPQPLLVILDLNGTLIYRKHRRFPPVFARRAGLDEFLDNLVRKYKVMIWSSSQPNTVKAVCDRLFPGSKRKALVAEWGRDKFGLTSSQYRAKIQVYKTLETVWSDKAVQASYPSPSQNKRRKAAQVGTQLKTQWDQSNTILIDDSKLKALSEPYNILEIPEFTNQRGLDESTIFPKVMQLLDELAKHDDVSRVLHQWNLELPENHGILELDLGLSSKKVDQNHNNTTTGDAHSPPSQQDIPTEPTAVAQARKERRKRRKEQRKARKQEQKLESKAETKTRKIAQKASPRGQEDKATAPATTPAATSTGICSAESAKAVVQPTLERSPSPATSSAESENFLLDRLEDSLNVRTD
ncbi:NLI interacting factor-like phosphatase-domain-containing protein [Aspergillus caelatus]|uniref:NLI interacting factor-like phosphatase-domain-containing protein n=2 Tax=Aspergillus subgen. Circumdati TaxID=2720871 RepID=A0A5N6ZPZ9_9EURO|nr:NLI interacting factor-like phosphatase-domain-containing protein [Aspergillus caelatus]KAE8359303.1 NLI interacting factor-like phosphatase-domain-containing protein [Aspergillus caelatus]